MWQERPSSAAASASMRPSWPPPRIPTIMPGRTGDGSFIVRRALVDGRRLGHAPAVEPAGNLVAEQSEHGRGEEGSIDRARAADGERPDRHAGRHLDYRQEAVLAAERLRFDRHAEDRE